MMLTTQKGWIEIICGSMFSGKSEELIKRVKRARIAKQNVQVFKPSIDDRYQQYAVCSHNGDSLEAEILQLAHDLFPLLKQETECVAIDEIQFFDHGIIEVVQALADRGIRVIGAGLDQDFKAEAFGPMPELLAIAESVTKLQAICVKCGSLASRTQRLIDGMPAHRHDPIILVGASESYEPRCRHCHELKEDSRTEREIVAPLSPNRA